MKIKNFLYFGAGLILLASCEKVLELDPAGNTLVEDEALQTKEDLYQFMNSAYDVMANYYNGGIQNAAELLSDNVLEPPSNNDYKEVYNHNVLFFNTYVGGVYQEPYFAIFRANRIMEVMDAKDFGLSDLEKAALVAEALFIRAVNHWEIVKLWAQPYGYTPDNSHPGIVYRKITEFEVVARPSVASNYQNIIADLETALLNLPETNGVYATKDAARGFLAKIYFQMGKYQEAADYARYILDPNQYPLHTSVDRFQNESTSEAVFSTVSNYINDNQIDVRNARLRDEWGTDANTNPQLRMPLALYNIYAADTNDQRIKLNFEVIQGDEPFVKVRKFRRQYFNIPIINTTDLKLLRAEALARLGVDLATAIQDVNDIRERAYNGPVNNLAAAASATAIINAAQYERRIEMIGEGDRIQQIKRLSALHGENIGVRGDSWNCNGMILQFPAAEQTDLFELNPTGGCE